MSKKIKLGICAIHLTVNWNSSCFFSHTNTHVHIYSVRNHFSHVLTHTCAQTQSEHRWWAAQGQHRCHLIYNAHDCFVLFPVLSFFPASLLVHLLPSPSLSLSLLYPLFLGIGGSISFKAHVKGTVCCFQRPLCPAFLPLNLVSPKHFPIAWLSRPLFSQLPLSSPVLSPLPPYSLFQLS